MKAGFLITAVGFFLSSFCFNVGGIRILPPFIGLFIMILGLSKTRNFYSSAYSRAASSVYKINAVLSLFGSIVSLSKYTEESPLGPILPALPFIYALSAVLCAVGIVLLFVQMAEYFIKYSTGAPMWKSVRIIIPALYSASQFFVAAYEVTSFSALSNIVFFSTVGVNLLLTLFLVIAAFSDHSAVKKESPSAE